MKKLTAVWAYTVILCAIAALWYACAQVVKWDLESNCSCCHADVGYMIGGGFMLMVGVVAMIGLLILLWFIVKEVVE